MQYRLNEIPHTGKPTAVFFNRLHGVYLELAMEADVPGEMTIYDTREDMEAHAPAGTRIPESVPFYQPEAEFGRHRPARAMSMVVTERDPDALLSAISHLGRGEDERFASVREDAAELGRREEMLRAGDRK